MLPPIGSVSMLPAQGRAGVVVGAQPLGSADDGRQLVALKIKAEASGDAVKAGGNVAIEGYAASRQIKTSNGLSAASEAKAAETKAASATPVSARRLDQLSATERADVAKLQQRDQQVRQEEKAHAAVAGDLAGPINYVYQQGPDGRQYAVGGSVSVRATTVTGDPEEAKRLSGRMAAAAHAATSPSAQDLATARLAYDFGSRLAEPAKGASGDSGLDLTL